MVNFTDAVYAIALTLLALDLRVGELAGNASEPAAMWHALGDLVPQLVAFLVAFWLLAQYWVAHHDFMARVETIDRRLMLLNLAYLGTVAFLPFPASLIGEHESNPISGVVFALSLAAISGMETVMLWHAGRAGLLREQPSEARRRWELSQSLQPAAMFVATIPLAFVDPTWMLVSWVVLGMALGRWSAHHQPER